MTEPASGIVEDRDGDTVTVTIARPEKRNALSTSALSGLAEVFERLASDRGLRFVVLTGAGDKAFASGGDLGELSAFRSEADARAMSELGKRALAAIRNCPVPVIARLNGVALGGGAELALACDLRFAAAHVKIGFIQARLAIAPAWGGGVDLMRLVGPAMGLRLLAGAEALSPEAAQGLGLVDACAAPGEDFDAAFESFVAPFRRHPPQVLRAMKSLARGERNVDRSRLDAEETARFVEVWTHEDHWTAADAVFSKS